MIICRLPMWHTYPRQERVPRFLELLSPRSRNFRGKSHVPFYHLFYSFDRFLVSRFDKECGEVRLEHCADRNTVAQPAEEEETKWWRARLCVYRHWQYDRHNVGCDTENVAVWLGFVQVWFLSVVWNRADCNYSQDQWQNKTYPHVYREYVKETTPPWIF